MFKPKVQRMSKKRPKGSIMKKMQEHALVQESHATTCSALIEKIERSMLRYVHLIPWHKEGGLTAIFCVHPAT